VRVLALILAFLGVVMPGSGAQSPTAFNVAHRGASAYAPEHTLDAYRLALTQGADYVEQDLGVTRDGVLVCLHDLSLERTTNVEELFPDRVTIEREDGRERRRWYVDDFTLAEIKQLDAGSWFDPSFAGARVATFQEAIDLVKGKAGIFPELKGPARLRAKGISLEEAVVTALERNGLTNATVKGRPAVLLQSFEEQSLRTLAQRLPAIPRTFLIGTPEATKRWLTAEGLREMRAFVTGIGPARPIVDARPALVAEAHAAGLTVVPWTFRAPRGAAADAKTATDDMRRFIETYGVDGLFTDNPDLFPRK
jgi:glycerophosphoryl diester phosphodiesterase